MPWATSLPGNFVVVCTCTSHTEIVAEVDPDDDEIERFVVRRYAYDPARHQRRHLVVVAFDNHQEFETAVSVLANKLEQHRRSDADIDARERISGVVLGAGHQRKQRVGRIVQRAIRHGVTLTDETWGQLISDLPSNVGVIRAVSDPQA